MENMPTFYTGYFARAADYPNPIAISAYPPEFWGRRRIASWLAPPGKLLGAYKKRVANGTWSSDENKAWYTLEYTDLVLKYLSPEIVAERLCKEMNCHSADQGITLLCFEKPPEANLIDPESGAVDVRGLVCGSTFCHRHLVSAFLRSGGFLSGEFTEFGNARLGGLVFNRAK
jgi:hypothetical protein